MKRLRVKYGVANVRELLMTWTSLDLRLSLHRKDTVGMPRDAVKQNLDTVKTARDKPVMAIKQLEKRQKKRASGTRQGRGAGRKAAADAPYHHGALHEALLQAAETILERDGLQGLTLRAAAREAGVSHAAPTHHFGDMSGLLSELAASGFRKFGAALGAAAAAKKSAGERMDAMGEAYVMFACEHPSMFLLMFRSERLDVARPALHEAMQESFGLLMRGVSARHEGEAQAAPPLAILAEIVRAWSMVHGFAMLMIDHRLDRVLSYLPKGTDARDLLRAMLRGK
jgi:AcrR family transcriptional regulator